MSQISFIAKAVVIGIGAMGALGAIPALGFLWWNVSRAISFADVQPYEMGVLVSEGQVLGTLTPGLHQFDARTQEVHVYPASIQREYHLPAPIIVDGCPSDVSVVWIIEDVEAWHMSGGQTDAGPELATEVRRLAQTFSEFGDDPRTEMQVFVHRQMEDFRVDGAARDFIRFTQPQC